MVLTIVCRDTINCKDTIVLCNGAMVSEVYTLRKKGSFQHHFCHNIGTISGAFQHLKRVLDSCTI